MDESSLEINEINEIPIREVIRILVSINNSVILLFYLRDEHGTKRHLLLWEVEGGFCGPRWY